MNRRLRSLHPSGSHARSDRFLKPGALARIRDNKISARSPTRSAASAIEIQQFLCPMPSPARSIAAFEGTPCFAGRSYGPRFLNRKKLVASKRVFFVPASADPVMDLSLDAFGADLVAAH